MAAFLSFPILMFAAVLQATLLPQFRLGGGAPDLVYLLVLAWAINAPLQNGVLWAFVGGIFLDLFSVYPLGTSSFGMLLVVFALSGLGEQVYRVGFFALIALGLVGTVVQQLCIMGVLTLTGHGVDWQYGLTEIIPFTLLYNGLLIIPVYGFVRGVQRRIQRRGGFSVD
jgi:rod shape-determining protein MreD